MIEQMLFYIIAGLAVLCALMVVTRKSPVTSAMFLMAAMLSIAGIYALLEAHFVFITQVLVYTGGIVIVIIFAIMLLNLDPRKMLPAFISRGKALAGALLGFGFLQLCFFVLYFMTDCKKNQLRPDGFGSIAEIGRLLLTDYVFMFEASSILILATMLGAVVLTRKRVNGER